MRNPLLEAAADVANAINALRLKRHTLRPNGEGVVIEQLGKPDLLLTYESARRFARDNEEAAHG
jgi:hypothetical protein